ncbi:E3 ubiquitin-protein ligase RNF34-like [Chenopodium quinoa]|uniref:E3 ubiquitin-protein ligase RNF34-like n=1 Tax=Chenopodium quinoa TaxID=63459 RepID=UPI000B79845E|nr:E3 ubiquitin-protein ligase RNF34-like [Chenopodium quinoa]
MACASCFVYYFMIRLVAYFAVLALLVIVTVAVLKFLGEWTRDTEEGESNPLMSQCDNNKIVTRSYGTYEHNLESQSCSNDNISSNSSKCSALYDANICIICYDAQRNCFFVPCGHCATCFACAQRIFYEENRHCPVCRRFIGKIRRLISFYDN